MTRVEEGEVVVRAQKSGPPTEDRILPQPITQYGNGNGAKTGREVKHSRMNQYAGVDKMPPIF